MGAWGTGIFQDDEACDIRDDAMEGTAAEFVERALEESENDDIDYTIGQTIIVAGVIADSILNGSSYDPENDEWNKWLAKQDKKSVQKYKSFLVAPLQKVLHEESELSQLWSENAEEYPNWKANIMAIIQNLSR